MSQIVLCCASLMVWLALIYSSSPLSAQWQVTIRGIVTSDKKPLSKASVALLSVVDSIVMSYAYTDAEGRFELIIRSEAIQAILSIRSLGYKPYRQTLTLSTDQTLQVELKEDTRLLREVVVRSPRVWGSQDTINYNIM